MVRLRLISVLFLLCLTYGYEARGQNDWDAVLDRYESICVQCKELREKAAAGEPVPQGTISSLVGELGRLREILRKATGSMTDAQKKRYARIRDSYLGESEAVTGDETVPVVKKVSSKSVPKAVPPKEETPPPATSRISLDPVSRLSMAELPTTVRSSQAGPGNLARRAVTYSEAPALTQRKPLNINIIPIISLGDSPNFGGMLSLTFGKWGGYASGRSNFTSTACSYGCLSDGSIDGGRFWGNGKDRLGELYVSLGPLLSLTGWISVFAGVGYGRSVLCWEDSAGQWAKVRDASAEGLLVETGAVVNIGKARILGGISWLTSPAGNSHLYPAALLGVGIGL